jgi:hypothetical protein
MCCSCFGTKEVPQFMVIIKKMSSCVPRCTEGLAFRRPVTGRIWKLLQSPRCAHPHPRAAFPKKASCLASRCGLSASVDNSHPIRRPTLAPAPPPLSYAQLEHLEGEGPRRPCLSSLAVLEAEETPW